MAISVVLKAILIGAGQRGTDVFGALALEHNLIDIIAVAEPNETRRDRFAKLHSISEDNTVESYEELLQRDKFAEAVIITTSDNLHADPAIAAMRRGYDVLLEKPMALSKADCIDIVAVSEETGRILLVAHTLRYSSYFAKLKEEVEKIGQIVNITWRENVSYWHYAHSFVRGNWATGSPFILAKTCHDLDLISWLVNSPVESVVSHGGQDYLYKEMAPAQAERCLDCDAKDSCRFSAKKIYLELEPMLKIWNTGKEEEDKLDRTSYDVTHYSGWPVSVITDVRVETSQGIGIPPEAKYKALQEGPYGVCVYGKEDHTVVDHQMVQMEFASGALANLTTHGFSHLEGREFRIDGTDGTITGSMGHTGNILQVYSADNELLVDEAIHLVGGHGGGDEGVLRAFVNAVESGQQAQTSARASLESHLIGFAAEVSRAEGRVLFRNEFAGDETQ
ncbi:MAG: Gfo/Idh/MocA family protein [Candidatus Kariarchaeaceae archaeon]|jgi:predicted dehydrogenase